MGLLAVGLGVVLGLAMWGLPREHAQLPAVARQALIVAIPKWHILEPVNEVVYGTRGFDTFGETFLLLAAVVGIGLISRRREPRSEFVGEQIAGAREERSTPRPASGGPAEARARAAESEEQGRERGPALPDREPLGTPGPELAEGMSIVVRAGVRTLAPLLAITGIYLAAWGYSPGGGFPAGAVLLGVVLLAYVALGYRRIEPVVRQSRVEVVEMIGALLIIGTEVGGLIEKGSFSSDFLPLSQVATIPSGGILQTFSGSELVEVATGLTLAVFGLLAMAHDWAADDASGEQQPPRGSSRRSGGRKRS